MGISGVPPLGIRQRGDAAQGLRSDVHVRSDFEGDDSSSDPLQSVTRGKVTKSVGEIPKHVRVA
jgi:hypothetical protein